MPFLYFSNAKHTLKASKKKRIKRQAQNHMFASTRPINGLGSG